MLELAVQDFEKEEVKEFLKRWFETVELALHPGGDDDDEWRRHGWETGENLANEIEQSEHIRELAVNPLLLQIIALIKFDRGEKLPLPSRRIELYQECCKVLLEKWDMAKDMPVKISAMEARQILQPAALYLHQIEERRSAQLDDMAKVVGESLEKMGKHTLDPKKLLLNIRERSGVFTGYSASEYGFTHQSFQAYFAAEEIRNTRQVDMLIDLMGINGGVRSYS